MTAFALAHIKFFGSKFILGYLMLGLLFPAATGILPLFIKMRDLGMLDSHWGIITVQVAFSVSFSVLLFHNFFKELPDELIDAARMDKASEWQIYWRIILPLTAPALAVLAIFSVVWRWNDFLWPLIVLSRSEKFTLQLALNAFQGELTTQWHYLLAMTVITLLPVTLVFAFLQRHITAGIASAGIK